MCGSWDGYVRHKSHLLGHLTKLCVGTAVRPKSCLLWLPTRHGVGTGVILDCRIQRVVVGTAMSDTSPVHWGILQGSVLGPVLLSMVCSI